jgi:hypothetical protein
VGIVGEIERMLKLVAGRLMDAARGWAGWRWSAGVDAVVAGPPVADAGFVVPLSGAEAERLLPEAALGGVEHVAVGAVLVGDEQAISVLLVGKGAAVAGGPNDDLYDVASGVVEVERVEVVGGAARAVSVVGGEQAADAAGEFQAGRRDACSVGLTSEVAAAGGGCP